jgi:hypothetical protein
MAYTSIAYIYVEFGVLAAVIMKAVVFWDVTAGNPKFRDVSEERSASIFKVDE